MLVDFPPTAIPYKEVIDAIHQFSASTLFFYWLGKETIEIEVVLEKLHEEMYERIMEYSLDGHKIFSVGGHINLPCVSHSLRDRMNSEESTRLRKFFFFDFGKFHSIVPELAQLEKKNSPTLLKKILTLLFHSSIFKKVLAVPFGKSMNYPTFPRSIKQERLF